MLLCSSPALQLPHELLGDGAVSRSSPYPSAQPGTWASGYLVSRRALDDYVYCSLHGERGPEQSSASLY